MTSATRHAAAVVVAIFQLYYELVLNVSRAPTPKAPDSYYDIAYFAGSALSVR